jgi:hypothetical protein
MMPELATVQVPLGAYTAFPALEMVTPEMTTIGLTSAGELSVSPTVVLLLIVVMNDSDVPRGAANVLEPSSD